MRTSLGLASALFLLAAAVPAAAMTRRAGPRNDWIVYFDAAPAEHQAEIDLWRGTHTLRSLSLSGTATAPLFATVWVRGGAIGQIITPATCCSAEEITDYTGGSNGPIILTAVGTNPFTARFAAVVESFHPGITIDYGLTKTALEEKADTQLANGYTLRWTSAYGTSSLAFYTAVWERFPIPGTPPEVTSPDTRGLWGVTVEKSSSGWAEHRDGYAQQWVRPGVIAPGPDDKVTTVWLDSLYGGDVEPFVGLTRSELIAELDRPSRPARAPVTLQAFGGPRGPTFAAVFADPTRLLGAGAWSWERGLTREWHAEPAAVFAGFTDVDAGVKAFMFDKNVRAAQVAVTYRGRLVYARAYTWAELSAGYPVTTNDRYFHWGSQSKFVTAFTAYLMAQTFPASVFSLSDKLVETIDDVAWCCDARLAKIKLSHLLAHTSGFPKWSADDDAIDAAWGPLPRPIKGEVMLEYELVHPTLTSAPGTDYTYSGLGYFMAGEMMGRSRGRPFLEVLDDYLYPVMYSSSHELRPSNPLFADQQLSGQPGDDVRAMAGPKVRLGDSEHSPGTLVPPQYGGANPVQRAAAGGMSGTAAHIVKLYAALSLPASKSGPLGATMVARMLAPNGVHDKTTDAGLNIGDCDESAAGEEIVYYKGGTAAGGESKGVLRTSDGVAIAFVYNRRMDVEDDDDDENGSIDHCQMMGWLDGVKWTSIPAEVDLFTSVGVLAFPDAP